MRKVYWRPRHLARLFSMIRVIVSISHIWLAKFLPLVFGELERHPSRDLLVIERTNIEVHATSRSGFATPAALSFVAWQNVPSWMVQDFLANIRPPAYMSQLSSISRATNGSSIKIREMLGEKDLSIVYSVRTQICACLTLSEALCNALSVSWRPSGLAKPTTGMPVRPFWR